MILSRTPFRISFFGGGTDYPLWYREHGGCVLATTIDKYCYISVRSLPPFFEHKHRIVYSQIEGVKTPAEIKHPAVRALLQYMEVEDGLEIHHDADLPAKSGLGSSSSFTVGLMNALGAHNSIRIEKMELARRAIHVEQNVIKETVGSQDQIAAAFGGFNHVTFHRDDTFTVEPVILKRERKAAFEDHLMLFFTGFSRFASEVARTKVDNLKSREAELKSMAAMVPQALSILQSDSSPIDDIGKMLHESWMYKRSLSTSVSSPQIDEIYQAGLSAGASGGKLLGAGGGGFILFFVKPEFREKLKSKLSHLIHVDFKFENDGSRIVMYEPRI